MPSLRILHTSFEIELPYAEGSIMGLGEASELNKLRVARIAERARNIINARGPGADPEEVRRELEAMARNYAFEPKVFELPPDPQEREALKIARALANERVEKRKQENPNLPEVDETSLARIVSQLAQEPRVRAEASRRVELAKKVTADALGTLDELLTTHAEAKR